MQTRYDLHEMKVARADSDPVNDLVVPLLAEGLGPSRRRGSASVWRDVDISGKVFERTPDAHESHRYLRGAIVRVYALSRAREETSPHSWRAVSGPFSQPQPRLFYSASCFCHFAQRDDR